MSDTGQYKCELCGYSCRSSEARANHLNTKRHFVEFLKYYLWQHEEKLVRNKRNVTISCLEIEDSVPSICFQAQQGRSVELTLQVEVSSESPFDVTLQACTLLHPIPIFSLDDPGGVSTADREVTIPAGSRYCITLRCQSPEPGKFRVPLAFKFREGDTEGRLFTIVRYLEVTCYEDGGDDLEPLEPYYFVPPLPMLEDADRIIRADKITNATPQELELKLPLQRYELPKELVLLQQHNMKHWDEMEEDHAKLLLFIQKHLDDPLSESTYWGYFSTLLFLEEIQMFTDIRKYDMKAVPLRPCPTQTDWFVLEVPGLVEGRPALLKGDRLYARLSTCDMLEVLEYEGIVRETKTGAVWVSFSKRFLKEYVRGMKFDVRFTYNRLPLRLMHRAIAMCEKCELWNFVLPKFDLPSEPAVKLGRLTCFNKNVQGNSEQFTAVKNILLGVHRPYPYLLFGPPGTGKTVTLVEALKQICHIIPSSHILVLAPSNSASDLLAERLLEHLMPSQIFRMYATSVNPNKVSKKLMKCCNYKPNDRSFFFPACEKLQKYKVIVSTLATSGKLVSAKMPLNHFTHVFVDEAGHSLEPECLIPVVGLMSPWEPSQRGTGGHLVLAGDPLQLGPVIRSKLARSYGFGVSLLERLMELPPYQRLENGHYNPQMLTKLLKNFRSHADILEIPNHMFYEEELQVYADDRIASCMLQWEGLPRKGVPLLFHGVCGRDLRESSNPSYYNPEEAKVVVDYATTLLQGKSGLGVHIREEDVGIISPYRKQVLKIRTLLEKRGHGGITVGSTEEFQGQERLVIIISTVRSNPNLLGNDFRHDVGFLKNRKRFNVAVTRAKSLLIVVGNPHTLSKDPCWRRLLQFCVRKRAYKGVPFGERADQIEDLEQRFAMAGIVDEISPEDELVFEGRIPITQKTLQEEPRWREEL